MSSPGGSPYIRVVSVWTTVARSTVAGSSSRTPSTSLTVAAFGSEPYEFGRCRLGPR